MSQVYIKLQTPTIELDIKAEDGSGDTDKIVCGFLRPESDESKELLQRYDDINAEATAGDGDALQALMPLVKERISYLKDIKLYDEKGKVLQTIQDTRTVKDNADLWGASENCLSFLLDMYLASTPWRLAFSTALVGSLANVSMLGLDSAAKN